jgi:hypothetical protein
MKKLGVTSIVELTRLAVMLDVARSWTVDVGEARAPGNNTPAALPDPPDYAAPTPPLGGTAGPHELC